MTHDRFKRSVWAFKANFTGALAKWLVRQSPYVVPDNLSVCIEKFHAQLDSIAEFEIHGMAQIDLLTLTETVHAVLESIPEVMVLNESKNQPTKDVFTSRYHDGPSNPDDDFIDILAVAQNITCELATECFATDADSQCWLDQLHKETAP